MNFKNSEFHLPAFLPACMHPCLPACMLACLPAVRPRCAAPEISD